MLSHYRYLEGEDIHISLAIETWPTFSICKTLTSYEIRAAVLFTITSSSTNACTEELECLESDSALMYDQFKSYAHPETKTATFSMDLEKFPNTTFLTSSREVEPSILYNSISSHHPTIASSASHHDLIALDQVLPDIFLCLCIAHNRTSPRGPRLPSVPKAGIPKMWIRNRWDQFMEECIYFVNLNRDHSVSTRAKLPGETDTLHGNTDKNKRVSCRMTTKSSATLTSQVNVSHHDDDAIDDIISFPSFG